MNIDLARSEIHTLIQACRDRRDLITRAYDGANAGTVAVELGTIERAERKLREAIHFDDDRTPGYGEPPHETDEPHYERDGPQS